MKCLYTCSCKGKWSLVWFYGFLHITVWPSARTIIDMENLLDIPETRGIMQHKVSLEGLVSQIFAGSSL